jgi:hypothetical protein
MITTSELIELVQDCNTIVMEIGDIPNTGISCIILVHGGEWVKAECDDDVGADHWVIQKWPLYPKCEGPVPKEVAVRWLKG